MVKDCLILAGAGVGGGSLVYANTLYEPLGALLPRPAVVAHHRLEVRARALLRPGQADAGRRRRTRHDTPADEVMKQVADEMGVGDTFRPTPVGVFFGEPGQAAGEDGPDPFFGGAGPGPHTCINCGACMTGCRHNAKNTLVKNYLHLAEQARRRRAPADHGHPVRPRDGGGYEVDGPLDQGQAVAPDGRQDLHRRPRRLLGRRARHPAAAAPAQGRGLTCPAISDRLGRPDAHQLRGHPRRHRQRRRPSTTREGVAITSSFHPDEHTHVEPVRYGARLQLHVAAADRARRRGAGRAPRWRTWLARSCGASATACATSTRSSTGRERTVIALVMQSLDNSITTVGEARRLRLAAVVDAGPRRPEPDLHPGRRTTPCAGWRASWAATAERRHRRALQHADDGALHRRLRHRRLARDRRRRPLPAGLRLRRACTSSTARRSRPTSG